ncbi:MAG: hypothetical protein EAZ35_09755 [Sphingobacteriia bacterium]|nr:MAG: hypothetical protein EAZ41_10155 [Sphingobacteriia bacterium]TAG29748.1 MAG: hypothetical protein EAZ35_09755 [Sphingobacteriia bacterium]
MKYILILKAYLFIALKVYWLNKKYTNSLFKELDQILKIEMYSLSKELKKRIFSYTAISCIYASWICALRGKGLTQKEKKNLIYLGAITPILDDLTDSLRITSAEILHLLKNKNESEQHEIIIAKYLYKQLQNIQNEDFNSIFEEALISQDASILQLEERFLNENELREITCNKGGVWALLYRAVLDNPLKLDEKDVLITLGYALQQTNDMFDIYKDNINKQQTSFTNSKDINKNHLAYESTLKKIISQLKILDYNKKDIEKCLIEISTITSRGMVFLNQLILLQGNSSDFNITKFTRKQLVCDMEKIYNIRKSIFFSVQFYEQCKTYDQVGK